MRPFLRGEKFGDAPALDYVDVFAGECLRLSTTNPSIEGRAYARRSRSHTSGGFPVGVRSSRAARATSALPIHYRPSRSLTSTSASASVRTRIASGE
jgi:hypothetical protein